MLKRSRKPRYTYKLSRNQTLSFFTKNPQYVELIDTIFPKKPNWAFILRSRLAGETFPSIGKTLGFTRMRASQAEKFALKIVQRVILSLEKKKK